MEAATIENAPAKRIPGQLVAEKSSPRCVKTLPIADPLVIAAITADTATPITKYDMMPTPQVRTFLVS
jgi:hypothetical protein